MLQNAATHCNMLQHAATDVTSHAVRNARVTPATHCNTLQHAATHSNMLQHAAADVTSHAGMIARVIYTHTHTHICHYLIIRGQRPLRGHRSALIFIRGENISATLICTKDLQKQKI